MIRIPLLARDGSVRAWAVIDDEDAALAEHRWYLRNGYVGREVGTRPNRRCLYLHREVMGLTKGTGRGRGPEVDHINRNKLDNRRSNLRLVNRSENNQARGPRSWKGVSRFRGVSWQKNTRRWQAQAKLNGVRVAIGLFRDEVAAARAAEAWRAEHMPYADPDPALAELDLESEPASATQRSLDCGFAIGR